MADKNKIPQNQPLVTFVTPKQDILLYVVQDSKSPPFSQARAYGSPYPNKSQYPDHELVFISPVDEDGNQRWYYARTRDKQEEYNFEISYPYGGRTDAPRYTRTYFLKREGYAPLTAGSADPVFSTAILVGQELKRIGQQELDSLYVLAQRTYDTIPAATEFDGASSATSEVYGIKVDFPYNDNVYPRLTWRIPVKHSAYTATADLTACPVSGYTSLVLVDQEYQQDDNNAKLGAWVRVYEILPSRVNYTPATHPDWGQVHIYSWRQAEYAAGAIPTIGSTYAGYKVLDVKTTADRGSVIGVRLVCAPSTTGTSKASQEIDQIFCVSTVVEQVVPAGTAIPARGSSYTNGTASGYVLDAKLKNTDGVNATIEVKLTTTNQVTISETKIDMETGISFQETQQYVLTESGLVGYGVQPDGSYRETKKIGCNFWVSTTSKTTTLTTESYGVVVPGKWPAVLQSISFAALYLNDNTTIERYIVDYEMKKAYVGHCKGLITRQWTKNAPPISVTTTTMIPEGIFYDGIFINVRIPECLHQSITFSESTGNNHPRYAYASRSKTFSQTNYTAWPASYIADVNVERYRGGYVKESLTIYAPT